MFTDRFTKSAGASLLILAFLGAATFLLVRDEGSSGPQIDGIESELTSGGYETSDEKGPAPDFELASLSGEPFRLSEQRGKVVVINFWATWCGPCRVEIPDLIRMQEVLGSEDVQFVGISLDEEGKEIVEPFAQESNFNYPILLDDGSISEKFGGIYALPTTIIVDRKGIIQHRIPGMVTSKYLMPVLQEIAKT
jgi:thiol-disulfide isomerase/thioredoxin